jgi:hypothetical protein
MAKIIFDEYLTNQGLTAENFRAAINLSSNELAGHTLNIRLVEEAKKHGTFLSLQIFLDNNLKGITIGLSGYKKSIIEQTIKELQTGTKLRGVWPKNQSFLEWINEPKPANKQAKKAEKLANQRKQREQIEQQREQRKQEAKEKRKRNLFPRTLQKLKRFQKGLPEIHVLKTAYEELHKEIMPSQKTEECMKLDKILSVAIAYKQANFSDHAESATEEPNQISLWDHTQNLILKMYESTSQIDYQGIVFTRKQVETACRRVQTIKAEKLFKKLLAQIPESLDARIKALQQQAEPLWDKICLLDAIDLEFLQGYNHPNLNFSQVVKTDIQTQAQINDWITAWIRRLEKAIAAPLLVDATTKTILKLIASSPKYGVQTYAMWLGNSKAKTLQDKKLNKKYRYALKEHTIVAIAAKIEAIIGYQWLKIITVGTHHLPVLILSDKGKQLSELLEKKKLEQKKIKVTVTTAKSATVAPQPAMVVLDVHSHLHWLTEIQQKEHSAYVSFLNSPESVVNIADWSEKEVAAMQQTLNERFKGWQVLAQWKLSKHPIKYKPLQRLLIIQ